MFIEVDTAHVQDQGDQRTSCLAHLTGSSLQNRVSSDQPRTYETTQPRQTLVEKRLSKERSI
jgi:hypothetical protein